MSPDRYGRTTGSGLPSSFLATGSSSFTEFLAAHDPSLLPGAGLSHGSGSVAVPHGTTVVALTFPGGAVMAGDRRATMGNVIAQRDIEKVFQADEWSCVGIAGTAGVAVEMVRLFQVELEHYEKIEGVTLSLEGKANRLSIMLRGNLAMAMQGLPVIPVLAGHDLETGEGRIFSYDVTGGRYEEHRHHGIGSGSMFARGSLKKLWREDLSPQQAVEVALEALYDAADDDSATGGPDLSRGIFPVVAQVDVDGFRRWGEDELDPLVRSLLARRGQRPDGPVVPLSEV